MILGMVIVLPELPPRRLMEYLPRKNIMVTKKNMIIARKTVFTDVILGFYLEIVQKRCS
jgi:hypothetical protein